MDKITDSMMHILSCAINAEKFNKSLFDSFNSEDWKNLFRLSQKHDLAHILGDILLENGLPEDESVKAKFQKKTFEAVARYNKIETELLRIKKCLSDAGIPFMPLKGAVLRQLYPKPWYRTSCDIDVLIHPENIERAASVLEQALSYENRGELTHDIQMYAPGGVHLELHFTLIEKCEVSKSNEILADVWNYAHTEDGTCYILNDTMTLYYHIVHMAKHFWVGGCGVRPFADLFLMRRKYKIDEGQFRRMCEKSDLSLFATHIERLANVWFNNAKPDDISEKTAGYILHGGVYGNTLTLTLARQSRQGSKWRFLLSRALPSHAALEKRYPSLKQHPKLSVFYYIYRLVSWLFSAASKERVNEIKCSGNISNEDLQSAISMFTELGLLKNDEAASVREGNNDE